MISFGGTANDDDLKLANPIIIILLVLTPLVGMAQQQIEFELRNEQDLALVPEARIKLAFELNQPATVSEKDILADGDTCKVSEIFRGIYRVSIPKAYLLKSVEIHAEGYK